MKRFFWLMSAALFCGAAYYYIRDRWDDIPVLNKVSPQRRRVAQSAENFGKTSRQLWDQGRTLAQDGRELAEQTVTAAQSAGKDLAERARQKANDVTSAVSKVPADVLQSAGPTDGADGHQAKSAKPHPSGQVREDVH